MPTKKVQKKAVKNTEKPTERKMESAHEKPLIGFVGQGFVGKSYADDFEKRGYTTVRYSLEEQYVANKDKIKTCDIVLIAVPTPTTPKGFDYTNVEQAIALVGKNKIAVVKSTLLPGTAEELQKKFPDRIVLFSPEFLNAKTAAWDASYPIMNIIGFTREHPKHKEAAAHVLSHLPKSLHSQVVHAREAELIKYAHNLHGFTRVLFVNLMYDAAQAIGASWNEVKKAIDADPYFSERAPYYNNPVHKSGHPGAKPGRGAGGPCYIKDMAAFSRWYEEVTGDTHGAQVFKALEKKNVKLLRDSEKDLDLLHGVYGKKI